MTLHWTRSRFAGLALDDLYDVLALRAGVFVVEQRCAYLDPDGVDRQSWHVLGRDAQGRLRGALRVVDPGVKYDEPSIGRVAVAVDVRRTGAGRALFAEGLACCRTAWPGRGIRINAQAYLRPFYGGFGFDVVGSPYDEDGIVHVEMLAPALAAAAPDAA